MAETGYPVLSSAFGGGEAEVAVRALGLSVFFYGKSWDYFHASWRRLANADRQLVQRPDMAGHVGAGNSRLAAGALVDEVCGFSRMDEVEVAERLDV